MEPILTVDGLSISFTQYDGLLHQRRLPVIRDLSLTVAPGPYWGRAGRAKACSRTGFWVCCPQTATWKDKFCTMASR